MIFVNDRALLQLVQTGNHPALLCLYERYSNLVYSTALKILRSPASAEDVTQELFLGLWINAKHVQVPSNTLHGWMVVASRNRSLDVLRTRRLESLDNLIVICPSKLSERTEHRLTCEKILARLEADERWLMEMAYLEGMTHAEIASTTGWPLGTIKTVIRRALRAVKRPLR